MTLLLTSKNGPKTPFFGLSFPGVKKRSPEGYQKVNNNVEVLDDGINDYFYGSIMTFLYEKERCLYSSC